MQMRMWKTLGSATLVTQAYMQLGTATPVFAQQATAPASSADATSDYPGGTVEHQMEKMFEGEGGEGGLGITKMMPSVTVPALRGDQLTKVLTGNTVRSNNRFAVYFAPGGKADGWVIKYKPAAAAACTAKKPVHFIDDDGTCLGGFEVPVAGRWQVKGDKICMPGLFHGSRILPKPETCHYMALILNNVLFFTEEGDMLAKGWDLAKGDVRTKKI